MGIGIITQAFTCTDIHTALLLYWFSKLKIRRIPMSFDLKKITLSEINWVFF